MPIRNYPRTNILFTRLVECVRTANLKKFNALLKNSTEKGLEKLFNDIDFISGNTLFHFVFLQEPRWFESARKARNRKRKMFETLFEYPESRLALSHLNNSQETPLHIAIRLGYDQLAEKIINANIINASVLGGESALEYAAKYNRPGLYSLLLKKHTELNQRSKTSGPLGFTVEQIQAAEKIYIQKLQKKQIGMSILGTIMTIACPVGAVLAFNQLPVLSIFFSALIPGVGPLIALGAAIIMGGILFWSMYHKSSMKYGRHGQELALIEVTKAKIARLKKEQEAIEAELKIISETDPRHKNLLEQKDQITNKLTLIYLGIKHVKQKSKAQLTDWAKDSDRFRAHMLATGSFICAFSGILGVMGGIVSFMPAIVASSILLAGIPVVGWAALGVTLLIGAGVAIWAYKAKYKFTLEECSKQRRDLNTKQSDLYKETTTSVNRETPTPGNGYTGINSALGVTREPKIQYKPEETKKTTDVLPPSAVVSEPAPMVESTPNVPEPQIDPNLLIPDYQQGQVCTL